MTMLLHTSVCWFHPCQYHHADTDAHLQAVAKAFHANRWIFADRRVPFDGSHHIDNAGPKCRLTSCYDILRGMLLHCRVEKLTLLYIRNVHAISISLCPEWAACVATGSAQLSSGSAQLNSTQLSSAQLNSTQLNSIELNSIQLSSAHLCSAQFSSAHVVANKTPLFDTTIIAMARLAVSTTVVRRSGNCFDERSAHNPGIKS